VMSPVPAAILLLAFFFLIVLSVALRGDGGLFERRGSAPGGLRARLAFFPMALVLAAVFTVSIPLYRRALEARNEALMGGLWERSSVLLEAMGAAAIAHMLDGDEAGLGRLPALAGAVPEACFAAIAGGAPGAGGAFWAGGTPGPAGEAWDGPQALSLAVGAALAPGAARLLEGPRGLPEDGGPGAWVGQARSEPEFAFRRALPGDGSFAFYRPIAYFGPDGASLEGIVLMGVCVGPLLEQAGAYREALLRGFALSVFAAFALGAAGVAAHSSLAAMRVRALLAHARAVLGASDERALSRMRARARGGDEVAALGDALDGIARRLAKTAATSASLDAGRKLQRKLLPLGMGEKGEAFDFSHKDSGSAVFFAYYEEAADISGDYFNYLCLDGRYYAVIKCDVAGSGAPAALITMQVSTMFLSYFWTWEPSRLMGMEELVYMINDFIERIGASRRFAAFTFCIYDSKTGDAHFCNAGDNVARIYDASEGRVKSVPLPDAPAAGILPYGMVAEKGGYRVQTVGLDRGDILLLYTDGLEESRRMFRGPVFDGKSCGGGVNRLPHGNYVAGRWGEELGTRRIYGIVGAVMGRRRYRLRKWHTPEGREEFLNFDFSGCRGGAEDAVLALVAVEKMFRCYRAPGATSSDRVLASRKVDAFLRAHFAEYGAYCSRSRDCPGDSSRVCYTHLREERRHDDMAILAIERKHEAGGGE